MDIIEDTKLVELPSGKHKILVKSYLTGEDRRATRRIILKVAEENKGQSVDGIEEVENNLMNRIVLELDDSKEDIVNRVLKLSAEDYDFVIETVNEISQGMSAKKEQKSDGSTKASSTEKA